MISDYQHTRCNSAHGLLMFGLIYLNTIRRLQIPHNLKIIRQLTVISSIYILLNVNLFVSVYDKWSLKKNGSYAIFGLLQNGFGWKDIFVFKTNNRIGNCVGMRCDDGLNIDLSTEAYRTKSSRANTISRIGLKRNSQMCCIDMCEMWYFFVAELEIYL